MAQYDLTNNDGTPFKTEAQKNFAAQPLRSDADMAIERTLNGGVSSGVLLIGALVIAFIVGVSFWVGRASK